MFFPSWNEIHVHIQNWKPRINTLHRLWKSSCPTAAVYIISVRPVVPLRRLFSCHSTFINAIMFYTVSFTSLHISPSNTCSTVCQKLFLSHIICCCELLLTYLQRNSSGFQILTAHLELLPTCAL